MKLSSAISVLSLPLLWAAVSPAQSPHIEKQSFGKTPEGTEVFLYTLKNASGMQVKITNFGGRITTIEVPDRNKKFDDVALGFDNVEGYTTGPAPIRQPDEPLRLSGSAVNEFGECPRRWFLAREVHARGTSSSDAESVRSWCKMLVPGYRGGRSLHRPSLRFL